MVQPLLQVKSSLCRNQQELPSEQLGLPPEGTLPARLLRLQRGLQISPGQVPQGQRFRLHRGRRQDPQLPQVSLEGVLGEEERAAVLLLLPHIQSGKSVVKLWDH